MGRRPLDKKIHLIGWETACMAKEKSGLGIKTLALLNRALLCKWN